MCGCSRRTCFADRDEVARVNTEPLADADQLDDVERNVSVEPATRRVGGHAQHRCQVTGGLSLAGELGADLRSSTLSNRVIRHTANHV